MEDKVDAGHHITQALDVAHIADVELDFIVIVRIVGLQLMAHVVLLFLVTAENADLADISRQKCLSTVWPKLPVPPVINKVLSLKMVFAMVSSCQGTNFWW